MQSAIQSNTELVKQQSRNVLSFQPRKTINTLNTEPKFQIPFCIRKFDQVFYKNYLFDIPKNITNHLYIVSGVKINQKNHDIYICHPYMGTSVFRNSKVYYKIINFFVDQFGFSQNVIKSCL